MATICLIGSARFADSFRDASEELTKMGHIVVTKDERMLERANEGGSFDADVLEVIHLVHLEKVRMADLVLVIDGKPTFELTSSLDPYIGQSTAREILWARQNDRPMISLLSASGWGNIDEMIGSRYAEDMFTGHEWLYNHARQVLRTSTGVGVVQEQVHQGQHDIMHTGLSVIAQHGMVDKATSDYAASVLGVAGLEPVAVTRAMMPEFDPTCILGSEPKKPAIEPTPVMIDFNRQHSVMHAVLSIIASQAGTIATMAEMALAEVGLDPMDDVETALSGVAVIPDELTFVANQPSTASVVIEHPEQDSNLVRFARNELMMIEAKIPADDATSLEMQQMMTKHILHMVAEFSGEGHSGTSASYAIGALTRLLAFEPLSPLTGEPDEWNEVGEGMFQNRRCGHIFKDSVDGVAYDSQGKIFREPSGATFACGESRVPISFPYVIPDRPTIIDVQMERTEDGKVIEVAPITFTVPQGPLINAVTVLDEVFESLNHKGNRKYARDLVGRVVTKLRKMADGQG